MIGRNSKEYFKVNFSAEPVADGLFRTASGAFCLICRKQVKLVDYEQAVEFFKTDLEDIRELAENRQLHRIHNKSGATMICSDSLFTLLESRPTQRLKPELLPFELEPADFKTSEDI
jgi:hypothetical protein